MAAKFVINGRTCVDASKRIVKDKAVLDTRIASDNGRGGTEFINVSIWASTVVREGKKASQCDVYERWLKKGNVVSMIGDISINSWEKDGKKLSKLVLTATGLECLAYNSGAKKDGEEATAPTVLGEAIAAATAAPATTTAEPASEIPDGFLQIPEGIDGDIPF